MTDKTLTAETLDQWNQQPPWSFNKKKSFRKTQPVIQSSPEILRPRSDQQGQFLPISYLSLCDVSRGWPEPGAGLLDVDMDI